MCVCVRARVVWCIWWPSHLIVWRSHTLSHKEERVWSPWHQRQHQRASKKQVASLEVGKPTMLKTYLLHSLGLSSSLAPAAASFYHRASGCEGVCQRSTCSGARIMKINPHENHVKNRRFSHLERLTSGYKSSYMLPCTRKPCIWSRNTYPRTGLYNHYGLP